ncbi:1-deoxy-D-xylulose-5-phosphate synthase [archaeon]|jgi:transketolase|nr:1-deoxy-D-xylulose-5-phosphate synthase [archaeon]MBT6824234.1 1-deoxy-D-xylulose-5-phosphate synthase [archaeon]MBT7106772.1 1-deoxy-D-xylulose-5-phosphate synthase [archaeon]MBT7297534.1 1-deoxy-D-xylulose-5-phosphate synthase [archaeon]
MRNTFIKELEKQAETNEDIVVLVGDLGFSVFDNFRKKFPDRFFNMGIAEQNMMSVAAGLALNGKKVFVYSIIPFVTARCIEQIKNDICYPNLNVVIVGVGSGVSYGSAGFSHHAIEDIALMKSLSNMTVLTPSDPYEVRKLVSECCKYVTPTYLRLGKNNETTFNDENQEIIIGKSHYIKEGKDIAIIINGNIIEEAMIARKLLESEQINPAIISVPTLKPLDKLFFNDIFKKYKFIFIIEEHNKTGGLGDSLFALNKENKYENSIEHIAINDSFIKTVGDNKYIRKSLGLDANSIFNKIKKKFEEHDEN